MEIHKVPCGEFPTLIELRLHFSKELLHPKYPQLIVVQTLIRLLSR